MTDKNYRTGILKALNREEIMTAAYTDSEYYVLGYSFLPKENQYYTEDLEKYEQNVEEAKKLVAGGATELTIGYVRTDIIQEKMALAVQAELKAVGINVTLEGFEQAAYLDVFTETENTPYDIFLGGYVMGVDPYAYASLFVSDQEGMTNQMEYNLSLIHIFSSKWTKTRKGIFILWFIPAAAIWGWRWPTTTRRQAIRCSTAQTMPPSRPWWLK